MPSPPGPTTSRLFSRGSWPEARRIAEILRLETVGGMLLVGAAVLALIWDVVHFLLSPLLGLVRGSGGDEGNWTMGRDRAARLRTSTTW